MKHILLFGAGKSSTALIDYFLLHAERENWDLTVVDADLSLAQMKLGNSAYGQAVSFDVTDELRRQFYIETADIVISLLPPHLHIFVARECILLKKNLLTASYIDKVTENLHREIAGSNILFLYEMGLDPGLDHMSAKKLVDDVRRKGGTITSFLSYCGGLVAPESDDNPWHYKISWNPMNVVHAGKGGAVFRQNEALVNLSYKELFKDKRYVHLPNREVLCWYPNRDSLQYASAYGLTDCPTFIRSTLRHPDFIYGWKNLIDLKLTDETLIYETNEKTLMEFFREHMDKNQFGDWMEQKLREQFTVTQELLTNLIDLVDLEERTTEEGAEPIDEFMLVDDKGDLKNIDLNDLKSNAAASIAYKMHEAKLTLKQLFHLGLDDNHTMINKGRCSAAEVLQFALEKKLALQDRDKDRVVMFHEIAYTMYKPYKTKSRQYKAESLLIMTGQNSKDTAMARTVGMPLAVAAKLILQGVINLKGLQIPIAKEIYLPVLKELKKEGIDFIEKHKAVP